MQHDLVIQCRNKHCKQSTYDHNLHYVTVHTRLTHSQPSHCPMCPAQGTEYIKSRQFDSSDTLCIKLPKVTRVLACKMTTIYNNLINATQSRTRYTEYGSSTSTTTIPCKFTSVEDLIMSTFPKLVTSNGICPLHVQCASCRATFTLIRTNPTAHDMPRYCIWCSSKEITITLPSTDDTANLVLNLDLIEQDTITQLALVDYDIPVILMQHLYDQWSKQAKVRTLAEWMNTPSVQQVLQLVHSA